MKYKTYYICHHCINFITHNKNDLTRHFQSKKTCKKNYNYNFEDAIKISENRKYYLDKDEIIDKKNILNYIKIYENSNNDDLIIQYNTEKNELFNHLFDNIKNKYVCNDCKSEFVSKQLIEHHLLYKDKCNKAYILHNEYYKLKNKEEKKVIFENIEKKCITHHISFHQLEQILDNYISENNK